MRFNGCSPDCIARAGMLNTVTFGMYSGRQQGAAGGEGTDAEGVAKQAGDAAQQTVDSAKVAIPCSAWFAGVWEMPLRNNMG